MNSKVVIIFLVGFNAFLLLDRVRISSGHAFPVSEFISHPFFLLGAGFVLTTMVGGYLSGKIQRTNWDYQYRKERVALSIQEASMTFEELSSLMDKRLYRSRKVLYAFKDKERGIANEIDARYDEYTKFLYEWNDSLNSNISRLEIHFGSELRKFFEDRICADLRWVGILLRRLRYLDNKPSLFNVEKAIDITNKRVYILNEDMLKKIKSLQLQLDIML